MRAPFINLGAVLEYGDVANASRDPEKGFFQLRARLLEANTRERRQPKAHETINKIIY
jgi:hypothetical protein